MSKQGHSSDRPDPYEPFKRFYKDGGYVGSPNSKKNIEDDQTLYLSSQGFAGGGKVAQIRGLLAKGGAVADDMLAYNSQYYAGGGQVLSSDVNYLTPEVQQILDGYFSDRILDEDLDAADDTMSQVPEPLSLDLSSPNPFYPREAPEVRFGEGGKVGIIRKLLEYTE